MFYGHHHCEHIVIIVQNAEVINELQLALTIADSLQMRLELLVMVMGAIEQLPDPHGPWSGLTDPGAVGRFRACLGTGGSGEQLGPLSFLFRDLRHVQNQYNIL